MSSGRSNCGDDLYLVVHVPKTAGTSLRWALDTYFGKSRVIRDYGPDSAATSDIVQKCVYTGNPPGGTSALINEFTQSSAKVLIGHFPLRKYADYFTQKNIISFVRDPLVRICSEFLHRVKNESFRGEFSDFLQCHGFQNVQSYLLGGVSEDSFIGCTEMYRESLEYINNTFGWKLKVRRKNVAWFGGGQKFAESLSEKDFDMFNELNKLDIEFCQTQRQQFENYQHSMLNRAGTVR